MKKLLVWLFVLMMAWVSASAFEIGDYNEDVIALHEKLNELGYYNLRPESPWGSNSSDALRLVQKVLGLNTTGTVDDKDQLNEILSADLAGVNLLINTSNPQLGSSDYESGTWRAASGGSGLREVVEIVDAPVEGINTGLHIVGTVEDEKKTDVAIDKISVLYGKSYILSCYAKGTGRICIQHGKSPYPRETFDVKNEWNKYEIEFIIGDSDGSTVLSPYTNIYFGVPAGMESDVVVCGMALLLND